MSRALNWARERADWPNSAASRFVAAGGLRWHVQRMNATDPGDGRPTILLIHGTGASTHSWRDLAPRLAERANVVAVDLPGHGFTERPWPAGLSLTGMAVSLGALMAELDVQPEIAIGHSAGAALLARMTLDKTIRPHTLISLNGALLPFRGIAGRAFPRVAKLLFLNPLVPRVFALGAGRQARVGRLIRNTGSNLDARGLSLYARLFASPSHAGAALGMMARWDLDALEAELPLLAASLWLIVGEGDRAVPPSEADEVAARVPSARIERLPGLGHLAHEEGPAEVAALIGRIIDGHSPEIAR